MSVEYWSINIFDPHSYTQLTLFFVVVWLSMYAMVYVSPSEHCRYDFYFKIRSITKYSRVKAGANTNFPRNNKMPINIIFIFALIQNTKKNFKAIATFYVGTMKALAFQQVFTLSDWIFIE